MATKISNIAAKETIWIPLPLRANYLSPFWLKIIKSLSYFYFTPFIRSLRYRELFELTLTLP
jgi:hypothetical protein